MEKWSTISMALRDRTGRHSHRTTNRPGTHAGTQLIRRRSDGLDAGYSGATMKRIASLTILIGLTWTCANAQTIVAPGDATAGERFFNGKGNCASCHMVREIGRA